MSSTLFAAEPIHPQTIRFRRPQAAPHDLDLDEAFDTLKLPALKGRSPETIGEYRTHLRRWREFWDDHRARLAAGGERWQYRMTYPVLPEVGRRELLLFRDWLETQVDQQGRSLFQARTINKHIGSLQAILRAAEADELIPRAAQIPPLPTTRAAAKHWLSPDQLDALMEGCAVAAWPQLAQPAPLYWRTMLVLFCNYGFRTQELIAYESTKAPLLWSQVWWDHATPHPAGQAVCPWGWLSYTPAKQRREKPEPLVLPLNETAHRWLKAIAPENPEGPVFPIPYSSDAFYDTWQAILRAAGVKPKRCLDGTQDEYQLLHLRKTAITWLNDHRPGIAEYITGHGDDRSPDALIAAGAPRSKVQRLHYDNAENRVLEALLTLPQPPSFLRLRPDPQLRLF